jgi:hypothetical protein
MSPGFVSIVCAESNEPFYSANYKPAPPSAKPSTRKVVKKKPQQATKKRKRTGK